MCPGRTDRAKKGATAPRSQITARASGIVSPRDVLVLKTIALLGGVTDHVFLSSGDLGKLLLTTQQTASLWLLDLLKRGYLIRRAGSRKQGLRLTPNPSTSCARSMLITYASSSARSSWNLPARS